MTRKQTEYYGFNGSQQVVLLECTYSIHKEVANISMAAMVNKRLDFGLLQKALNLEAARNDSVRIRIKKQGLRKVQYFLPEFEFKDIPFLDFTGKTKEEQEAFFKKEASVPFRFTKEDLIKAIFCRTWDGRDMIYVKVCHLIMDTYAFGLFFKDVFEIYQALESGGEMLPPMNSFEECLKKDLEYLGDSERVAVDEKFFREYLEAREEPYFAPISGDDCKVWLKRKARGDHTMKLYINKNQTNQLSYALSDNTMADIQKLCEEYKNTPSNLLITAAAATLSKRNHNERNIRFLDLCNGRATALARGCGGSKVQSLPAHFTIDQDMTFAQLLEQYSSAQALLYRHLGYPDTKYERLCHNVYHSSQIGNYYSLLFSYIPLFAPMDGIEITMYSSGRFALPVYMGALHDLNTGRITLAYDYQRIIMNEGHVKTFEKMVETLLSELAANPAARIEDLLADWHEL